LFAFACPPASPVRLPRLSACLACPRLPRLSACLACPRLPALPRLPSPASPVRLPACPPACLACPRLLANVLPLKLPGFTLSLKFASYPPFRCVRMGAVLTRLNANEYR
jgi:hypothetical protein